MKIILRTKLTKRQLIDAAELGLMQFLNWGICTMSWRAVSQANYLASVITDTTLATLTFFAFKKLMKGKDDDNFIQWLGYTVGGVLGTVVGIWSSIYILGK